MKTETEKEKKPSLCERTSHLPSWEKGNNTCVICKQDITEWLKSIKQ